MPDLKSKYNLILRKPGIKYYEGKEGIKKVLDDSLTSKTEIYTYADLEAIEKYIPKINKKYAKKRKELNIKKRGIVLDTLFTRNFLKNYHKQITDTKLIKQEDAPPFKTIMQIYDNKISYLTLSSESKIGVIIEDPNIYKMHKYLFEYLWKITKSPII